MSMIRRYYDSGQLYFTTHVTLERLPILSGSERLLLSAWGRIRSRRRFGVVAWAILPDHFHMILLPRNNDLSEIVREVKLSFSKRFRATHPAATGRLWQYRFWDHVIRSEGDLRRHLDYIHYNPVKHGLAPTPHEYEWSSFGSFVRCGMYGADWASFDQTIPGSEFGE